MPKYLGKRPRSAAGPPSYKRTKFAKSSYMKRRPRRGALQLGKMTYMKCRNVQILDVAIPSNQGSNYQQIRLPVAWQRPSRVQVLQGAFPLITANPYEEEGRFAQVYRAWQQWAIKGVKLEFVPRSNIANADEIGTSAMYSMAGVKNLDVAATKQVKDLMMEPAFKILNPRRRWTKFISAKKVSKQQHLDWQDTTAYNQPSDLPTTYATDILSEAWTMLIWDLTKAYPAGATNDLRLGTLKITWFVTFRGQRSD